MDDDKCLILTLSMWIHLASKYHRILHSSLVLKANKEILDSPDHLDRATYKHVRS